MLDFCDPIVCKTDREAAEAFLYRARLHWEVMERLGGHGELPDNRLCYWAVHGPGGHVIGVR